MSTSGSSKSRIVRAPRESRAAKWKRAARIVTLLQRTYPQAECALRYDSPFQLLVATILSAQCTDERVNLVTPALFARCPGPRELADIPQPELERLIQSTGFFRNKATNLRGMAQGLIERHAGEVPRTLAELTQLPGVGRKTANVVLGTAFGIPSGVVVDTHVTRITRLLGLTQQTSAERIEEDLIALLPPGEWIHFSHRLIHHGRRLCIARRPQCGSCPLLGECPRVGLPMSGTSAADKPVSAKPVAAKTVPGKSRAARSVAGKSADKTSAAKRPVAGQSMAGRSRAKTSVAGKPATGKSGQRSR